MHANPAGKGGGECASKESDHGVHAATHICAKGVEGTGDNDHKDREHFVLSGKEGHGALLNGFGKLLHPVISGRAGHHLALEEEGTNKRKAGANPREVGQQLFHQDCVLGGTRISHFKGVGA